MNSLGALSSTISRRNWDDLKVPRGPRRRVGALCQIWQESEISSLRFQISISMKIFGNFQTSLTQFLEGVRTNQRYHDDRTDVLVLSAKSDRNLRFRIWDFNEDFEMLFFFQRISTKIETKSHFQKYWTFLAENPILSKIPFYLEKPSKVWKADNPILSRSHFIANVLYRNKHDVN